MKNGYNITSGGLNWTRMAQDGITCEQKRLIELYIKNLGEKDIFEQFKCIFNLIKITYPLYNDEQIIYDEENERAIKQFIKKFKRESPSFKTNFLFKLLIYLNWDIFKSKQGQSK